MKKLNAKQKKFLGTVPKKYQLVETFWDCPEISKTNNKGITLIALIITIIVMLILVGVTINVVLNGGLFEKAETAKTETNKAIEKEELTGIAIVAYDAVSGSVIKDNLNFNEKYSIDEENSTENKIVLNIAESGTKWQIDINTAKVDEYEEKQVTYMKLSQLSDKYESTVAEGNEFAGNKALLCSFYDCLTLLGRSYAQENFLLQFAKYRGFDSWEDFYNDPSTDPDSAIYETLSLTFKYKNKEDEGTLFGKVTPAGIMSIGTTDQCYDENDELSVDVESIEFSIVEFP